MNHENKGNDSQDNIERERSREDSSGPSIVLLGLFVAQSKGMQSNREGKF